MLAVLLAFAAGGAAAEPKHGIAMLGQTRVELTRCDVYGLTGGDGVGLCARPLRRRCF